MEIPYFQIIFLLLRSMISEKVSLPELVALIQKHEVIVEKTNIVLLKNLKWALKTCLEIGKDTSKVFFKLNIYFHISLCIANIFPLKLKVTLPFILIAQYSTLLIIYQMLS